MLSCERVCRHCGETIARHEYVWYHCESRALRCRTESEKLDLPREKVRLDPPMYWAEPEE